MNNSIRLVNRRVLYTMDVSTSMENVSAKTVKRKFMQWAWKWYYANPLQSQIELLENPDATSIICLLKSIGFQLKTFEKSNVDDNDNTKACENVLTLTIECGVSKMKAVMELDNVRCQCPNEKKTDEASFWSVSGIGSVDNVNKLMDTGSNLLPNVDKDSYKMMHDIVCYLLTVINPRLDENKTSANASDTEDNSFNSSFNENIVRNESHNSSSLMRCYTQPEIMRRRNSQKTKDPIEIGHATLSTGDKRMSMSNFELHKVPPLIKITSIQKTPMLLRQKTWDVIAMKENDIDPRPSPPKTCSTPVIVNELSSSLGQISLRSDELGSDSLAECLQKARFYIERAQQIQDPSSKKNDVFLRPSVSNSPRKSKSPPIRPPGNSNNTENSKSPSKLLAKNSIARRSVGALKTSQSQLTSALSPKFPQRGRSLAGGTPEMKQAVEAAQRKIVLKKQSTPLKVPISRSFNTSSNSSVMSSSSGLSIATTPGNTPKLSTTKSRYSTIGIGASKPALPSAIKNNATPKRTGDTSKRHSTVNTSMKERTPGMVKKELSTLSDKFRYPTKK